jgi:short-subunit dehydrogenase
LASRDEVSLNELVGEIELKGQEAIAVVADVGVEEDVHRLGEAALRHYGQFDTWINNAGTSIFGRLIDIPHEDSRRLFETNFWGLVYGSLEAVRHFCERAQAGALINVGSVLSDRAIPVQGMYCATKHAVKAFTDALRMELEAEGAPVSVTLVKPSSIDTPFPRRAKNWMDQEPTLPPPIYSPRTVAKAILHCATIPQRDVTIGGGGRLLAVLGDLAPRLTDRFMESTMIDAQQKGPLERDRAGTFDEPVSNLSERGDVESYVMNSSLYTKTKLHPLIASALIAGASFGIASLYREFHKRG